MPVLSGTGRSAKETRPAAAAAIRTLVTSNLGRPEGLRYRRHQSIENKKGGGPESPPPSFSAPSTRSEVELRAEFEETRLQHVGRTEVLARRQRRERIRHRER